MLAHALASDSARPSAGTVLTIELDMPSVKFLQVAMVS